MKEKLAEAFFAGRGIPAPALDNDAYPLATRMSEQTDAQVHVSTRPEACRDVATDYRSTEAEVVMAIKAALDAGRCVCWIRNTVADALTAYETLAPTFPADAVSLFHARFAMGDRLDQERRILTRFGPGSGAANRRSQLVIATQVIEQSLDVDFDLVITDLAPIDRIIQRAGRMKRHARDRVGNRIAGPDQRGGARLIVYGPTWAENPPANWYQAVFPRAAYVYNNPGELWLTARWLVRRGTFAMPGDAQNMVDSVFGDVPIPGALKPGADDSWGKAWAARNLGSFNALAFDAGYVSQGIDDWARDDTAAMMLAGTDEWGGAAAATRLGEPTLGVRLARWGGHTLTPWRGGDTLNEAWEASSVRMPARLFDDRVPGDIPQATVDHAREMMADHGRWSRLLVLSVASDDVWTGASTGVDGKWKPWRYDHRQGLREASSAPASA
jgi:CRISPR-associated endonuclease/helicase Cas3